MFHGSLVALVTPMHEDGSVDYTALERLIDWHVSEGTDGLVILGSTGEAATIEDDERKQIIQHVIKYGKNRLPVIVGAGSNATQHAIRWTKQAMELGADAALLVVPYYNRPTQQGLYEHFKAIAKAVPIPQIVYNVPTRTACDLLPQTVCRLADFSNIIGIKEATGDLSRVEKLSTCRLDLFSGDDNTALDFMAAGGKGWIAVVANAAPRLAHEMCVALMSGDKRKAIDNEHKLKPLIQALAAESNPIPIKWVLQEMGLIKSGIRLPLTRLSEQYKDNMRQILANVGLLNVQ